MKRANRVAWNEARRWICGGVNSPVRAFRAVGGFPPFIRRASGSRITDEEGTTYLDYVGSWGALILGHAHAGVVGAAREAASRGTTYGAPTVAETRLARMIAEALPSMERVRLVNSGTEACMSAVRLARGATRRPEIVKFEGGYHGHADGLLARAGSGAATFGVPGSAGVPTATVRHTHVVPYNDDGGVRRLFRRRGRRIAGMIVEPIAGNMGVVPPAPGFLRELRRITERHGSLLIFDEVITGFRFRFGGVQDEIGVVPDLTTLGKIIGGGFPLAAYGGRREIMRRLAPEGPVYQAGTLSGNPVAVAAGAAQLDYLRRHRELYARLESLAAQLEAGLRQLPRTCVNRVGSMLTLFFQKGPVRNFREASGSDERRFARFHRMMLRDGVYLPPSQYEAWFVSAAHTRRDVEQTLHAAREGGARA